MASALVNDGPVTVIVHLKIKFEHIARAEELWHEQIADIEDSEPPGNIKYSLYRNNEASNEYTVVEEYGPFRSRLWRLMSINIADSHLIQSKRRL